MQISYREECKRKLVHLSSLWMVLVILFLPGRWSAAILYAVMLVLNLLCEHAYACNVPVIRPLYGAIFGKMLDLWEDETPGMTLYQPLESYGVKKSVHWKPYSFYYMDLRPYNLSFSAR